MSNPGFACRNCAWSGFEPYVEEKHPRRIGAYCPRCGNYIKWISVQDQEAIARITRAREAGVEARGRDA